MQQSEQHWPMPYRARRESRLCSRKMRRDWFTCRRDERMDLEDSWQNKEGEAEANKWDWNTMNDIYISFSFVRVKSSAERASWWVIFIKSFWIPENGRQFRHWGGWCPRHCHCSRHLVYVLVLSRWRSWWDHKERSSHQIWKKGWKTDAREIHPIKSNKVFYFLTPIRKVLDQGGGNAYFFFDGISDIGVLLIGPCSSSNRIWYANDQIQVYHFIEYQTESP